MPTTVNGSNPHLCVCVHVWILKMASADDSWRIRYKLADLSRAICDNFVDMMLQFLDDELVSVFNQLPFPEYDGVENCLDACVNNGNAEMLVILLGRGVRANLFTRVRLRHHGQSEHYVATSWLFHAIETRDLDCIYKLIEAGADINVVQKAAGPRAMGRFPNGVDLLMTPLGKICEEWAQTPTERKDAVRLAEFLLKRGAGVDIVCTQENPDAPSIGLRYITHRSPLVYAIRAGHAEMVWLLLSYGANAGVSDRVCHYDKATASAPLDVRPHRKTYQTAEEMTMNPEILDLLKSPPRRQDVLPLINPPISDTEDRFPKEIAAIIGSYLYQQ